MSVFFLVLEFPQSIFAAGVEGSVIEESVVSQGKVAQASTVNAESVVEELSRDQADDYTQKYIEEMLTEIGSKFAHEISNTTKINNEAEYNATGYNSDGATYKEFQNRFPGCSMYIAEFEVQGQKVTDMYILDENNLILTSGLFNYYMQIWEHTKDIQIDNQP